MYRVALAAGFTLALIAQGPAAHADDIIGTHADDVLVGGPEQDFIRGLSGADIIRPRGARDTVQAGFGDDQIYLFDDDRVDDITCGPGFDFVAYQKGIDQKDNIDLDCEGVTSWISSNDAVETVVVR